MNVTLLFFAVAVMVRGESFFTYNDCDSSCKKNSRSCLIEEVTANYFSCECVSEIVCESHASPTRVCLVPNRPALGGEDIWIAFKNRNSTTPTPHPPSPSPNPTPNPKPVPRHPALTAIISITVFVLIATVSFFAYKFYLRRTQYSSLANEGQSASQIYLSTTNEL